MGQAGHHKTKRPPSMSLLRVSIVRVRALNESHCGVRKATRVMWRGVLERRCWFDDVITIMGCGGVAAGERAGSPRAVLPRRRASARRRRSRRLRRRDGAEPTPAAAHRTPPHADPVSAREIIHSASAFGSKALDASFKKRALAARLSMRMENHACAPHA